MIISNTELEALRECHYSQYDIGMVSDRAYLSIVMTNNCNKNCFYCINSNTDKSLQLPVDKAINNINKVVDMYGIKEAVILGGEPTLHPELFDFIDKLKTVGLQRFGITTNGIKLLDEEFCTKLAKSGVSWINISSDTVDDIQNLICIYNTIKKANDKCKVRINLNVYRGHNDTLMRLKFATIAFSQCCDEMRVSNLIHKDDFSVNPINNKESDDYILSDDEYRNLFDSFIDEMSKEYTLIDNPAALGFVRYILIPTPTPIIINYNIGSKVSEQICENDIKNRKIHTFKCLVDGDISLSWNAGGKLWLVPDMDDQIQHCTFLKNPPRLPEHILKGNMVTTKEIMEAYRDIYRRKEEDNKKTLFELVSNKIKNLLTNNNK